jgi:hypothetical protein
MLIPSGQKTPFWVRYRSLLSFLVGLRCTVAMVLAFLLLLDHDGGVSLARLAALLMSLLLFRVSVFCWD